MKSLHVCGIWWCKHDCHGQYLPQVKEKLLLEDIPITSASTHTEPKQILRCNNQANELHLSRLWNQWKHWAKWQRLGVNTITYTFSKIFQPELNSSFKGKSWTTCLRLFQRWMGKLKKEKHFLCSRRFHFFWWNSGTQKRVGWWNKMDQIDDNARLFRGSISKTKRQSLTSLTIMRLVPGANRVVCHICIRCNNP